MTSPGKKESTHQNAHVFGPPNLTKLNHVLAHLPWKFCPHPFLHHINPSSPSRNASKQIQHSPSTALLGTSPRGSSGTGLACMTQAVCADTLKGHRVNGASLSACCSWDGGGRYPSKRSGGRSSASLLGYVFCSLPPISSRPSGCS